MSDEFPLSLSRNRLLSGLDTHDLNLIRPQLKSVPLTRHQRLETANRPVDAVYFPESGLVSMVAVARGGDMRSNVAMIGFEGMTGISTIYGVSGPSVDTVVASTGTALSIDAATLKDLLGRSWSLEKRFTLYAFALKAQIMFSVLARAKGTIEQRLCICLLMAQDRLKSDEITLTHDTLADMLGIRRPAISIALRRLEQLQLVSIGRGNIVIRDRAGTIARANTLYGLSENEYERLLK